MRYQGTYEVHYDEKDKYGILFFPPLETDNSVLAEIENVYPNMRVPVAKVENGNLDKELAAIQRGEPLPTFEDEDEDEDKGKFFKLVKNIYKTLAQSIAENPNYLNELEWRELEKMLAEVLEVLGFSVELTPPSKDGGKDIILECIISGLKHTYIIEIKHWRAGSRVGYGKIKEFLDIVVREKCQGGLFLSTSGYCNNVYQIISEIEREQLKLGDNKTVIYWCKTYVKAQSGIWSPPELLTEVLFEETI